jgi:endonuclease/exonuclease/phosphatase (EEP) superfamily protein YafD
MLTSTVSRPTTARPSRWTLLGGVYGVAAIVALLAWWVVGDTWWTQVANLSMFWWSLPAVVLAPAAWLLGARRTALLVAVPAAAWLWSYATAFLPPGPTDAPGDLTVLSYNTFVHAPDERHVLDLVEQHDPDVVLLQEVFPEREERLREALGDRYPDPIVVQSPGVGGVAVFSRFPIEESIPVVDATTNSRSTSVAVVDVDGQRIQVVPVHLISPCPGCGPSVLERLQFEGEVRSAEMGNVMDALDPDLPAIVGGDFNSNDRSGPYRRLAKAGFTDPQRDAGSGIGMTWPNDGPVPLLRIDWVMVRGLDAVSARVVDGGSSDHRAVIVDLALRR